MGSKYRILWFDYPYNGYDGEYQTASLFKFLLKLIICIKTHDGVNAEVRW